MITVNGVDTGCAPGETVAVLVARLTPRTRGVAVAVNGEVVPRGEWTGIALRDGDRVEVLTATQGG